MLPFYRKGDKEFAGKIDFQYSFIYETSSDIPLIDYHLKSIHFAKTCQTTLQEESEYAISGRFARFSPPLPIHHLHHLQKLLLGEYPFLTSNHNTNNGYL
jgi:hypothetical protein